MADAVPALVPVINQDTGQLVHIPASDVDEGIYSGQYALPPNPNETLGNQARSFGEGLVQGFVPGGPKLLSALAPQTESIPQQNLHQQTFPGTHGLGFGIGAVGQGVAVGAATGGLGELLAPAAEAAADVGKGADVLSAVTKAGATPGAIEGATDAAAKLGPQTIEQVKNSSAAMPYVQQALAGGAYGGTNYTNESQLGDHNFNGEGLVQSIGLNLIGGGSRRGSYQSTWQVRSPAGARQGWGLA